MTVGHGVEVWSSQAWREQAISWLDERLASAGIKRTGEVEQPHLRPWATALRAPPTAGLVWLKAAAPGTAFEVRLLELLHAVCPAHVLSPIATDPDRGWILLPDGGVPLGERLTGGETVEAMVNIVVPQYGGLQRELWPHTERLLAIGVADMRPVAMPERFHEALDRVGEHVARRGDPAEEVVLRQVAAFEPQVNAWCERLASLPGPPSLDHNDLHTWNVFLDGKGQAKFYDWGDSVVAHPFSSMLVALEFVRSRVLAVDADDPQIVRLRDAYLEVFSDLAPQAELVETLELACRVGKIARTLVWDRAVRALAPDEVDDEWARAPLVTLSSLLDDSYLGGA
jgi:hypothetical protein